jgi:type II secretory ATPase GspE/PulE/Tfp pilus assembly ATPase PilB-like protein
VDNSAIHAVAVQNPFYLAHGVGNTGVDVLECHGACGTLVDQPVLHGEVAATQKVGGETPLGTSAETVTQLWKANPDGCDECGHTGYKGRIGIYEVLGINTPVQKLITTSATSEQIQDQAILDGMTTMQTDGLVKTLRGNTTLEEVLRVTRE